MRAPNEPGQAPRARRGTLSGKCKLLRPAGLTYNRIPRPHGGTVDGASGRAGRPFGAPAGRRLAFRAADVLSSRARAIVGRGVHRRCALEPGRARAGLGGPARERADLAPRRVSARSPQRQSLSRPAAQPDEGLGERWGPEGRAGLPTRGPGESVVASESKRCRRMGHPSSVLMTAIAHFKAITDRHGHPVGDEVIRRVAELLRRSLRLHDVPGRYGGEEFGVVLPGTGVEGAETLAERIRARIESAVLEPRNAVRATLSIGVAAFDTLDAGHMEWIARADRALYAAKESGRNRTARYVAAGG